LRDAVRGLHQGLSRLAEQIAKTATDSTSQITALSINVETLTGKVAAARDESDRLAQLFEEKLAALAERVRQSDDERITSSQEFSLRLKQVEERFEERLRETERRVAGSSNLDETVVKLESRMFAAEQRLEESLGRHLAGIERTLGDINGRLERTEVRCRKCSET
jgi:localization factor PodJL